MSEQNTHPIELLPWLANESLSGDERQQVEQHLAECESCRQELALLKLMRQEVKAASAGHPGELAKHRLMKEIAAEPQAAPDNSNPGNQPAKRWWQPAVGIAAALVIVIQSAVIINMPGDPTREILVSKSGDILIQFKSTATLEDINKLMHSVKGRITDGPVKGTEGEIFYEAVISKTGRKFSRKKLRSIIQKLKSESDLVTYVDSMAVDE